MPPIDPFNDGPLSTPAATRNIGAGIGNLIDKLMDHSDRIQRERGPLAGELFRGVAEDQLKRAGIPIKLRTPEERALEERVRAQEMGEFMKKEKNLRTENIIAEIMSDPEIGGVRLSERVGVAIDGSLLDNDESLLAVSRAYSQAHAEENARLEVRGITPDIDPSSVLFDRGDLFLFKGERLNSPAEFAAEDLGRRAKAGRDQQDLLESTQATLENRTEDVRSGGKTLKASPVAATFLRELAAGEERLGDRGEANDLVTSNESFNLDDDWDEAGGAAEISRAIINTAAKNPGNLKSAVNGLLQGDAAGKRISSIIRGATNLDPDTGLRHIQSGDSEEKAALIYIGLYEYLARQSGQDLNSLFTSSGMEAPHPETLELGMQAFREG